MVLFILFQRTATHDSSFYSNGEYGWGLAKRQCFFDIKCFKKRVLGNHESDNVNINKE
jgi:hypothetical protein